MALKGILYSITASCIFGLLYIYSQLFEGLNTTQVFAWRVICTLPFVFLFAYFIGQIHQIKEIYQRILTSPKFLFLTLCTSLLGGVQLWLFMWGPLQGRGLQVSLGYFLLPLVMVLVGRVFLKEQLSRFQRLAIFFASIGVLHEIWRVGSIAWETWLVAIGYTAYFWLRKHIHTNHIGGFFWDLLFAVPLAIYFISSTPIHFTSQISFYAIMLGFGGLSALGLGSYILANRYLSFSLFGLLSYLEPVLLALASLVLGEKIQHDEWWTYIPIWFAVMILALEGIVHLKNQNKNREI